MFRSKRQQEHERIVGKECITRQCQDLFQRHAIDTEFVPTSDVWTINMYISSELPFSDPRLRNLQVIRCLQQGQVHLVDLQDPT